MHFSDVEGMRMRPMALSLVSEEDVKAVAHYVETLPPVPEARTLPGDPKAGEALYATCSSCHGDNGDGNQDLGGPKLAGVDDWYLATQLRKFKRRHSRRESKGPRRQADAPDGDDASGRRRDPQCRRLRRYAQALGVFQDRGKEFHECHCNFAGSSGLGCFLGHRGGFSGVYHGSIHLNPVAGVFMWERYSTAASTYAHSIDHLFILIAVIVGFWLMLAEGAMFVADFQVSREGRAANPIHYRGRKASEALDFHSSLHGHRFAISLLSLARSRSGTTSSK